MNRFTEESAADLALNASEYREDRDAYLSFRADEEDFPSRQEEPECPTDVQYATTVHAVALAMRCSTHTCACRGSGAQKPAPEAAPITAASIASSTKGLDEIHAAQLEAQWAQGKRRK
jgi:hypothetical protein